MTKIKKIPVAAALIIKENNNGIRKLLLIRRSKTDSWGMVWEYPRGKCDKGDKTLGDCLKREVKEETGLDVDIKKYIGKFKYVADNGARISTQYNFLCTLKDKNQKIKLSFEHDGYKWISTLAEAELLVPDEMKKIISKILPGLSIYKRKDNEEIEE